MPHSAASATVVTAAQVREKCVELRAAGFAYRRIAKQVSLSEKAVRNHVKKALRDTRARTAETAEEVLYLELDRLDAMFAGIWLKAKQGDHESIDRALKIMQRRAALLGLDAPKKLDSKTTLEATLASAPGRTSSIDPSKLGAEGRALLRALIAMQAANVDLTPEHREAMAQLAQALKPLAPDAPAPAAPAGTSSVDTEPAEDDDIPVGQEGSDVGGSGKAP